MNKKVLLVATKERAPACMRALEDLGFESMFFEFRTGLVYKSQFIRRLIRQFPSIKFLKRKTVANINKQLLEEVERFRPDYLIATVAENIYPETILKIRSRGVVTANWFTDLFTHWSIIQKIAPAYTLFFSSDSAILEKLKELRFNNCFYLPEAFGTKAESSPFEKRENLYDVTFIGSYNHGIWQHRERFLGAIKDLGLNIWGSEDWKKTSLKAFYHGPSRSEHMLDIYRKSKIAFEIPWDDKLSQAIGSRPFEVMFCGACLFVYDIRKDMAKNFIKDKEYIPFLTEEELRSKVKYFLANDDERLKIAKAAYDSLISKHTFRARIKTIIDTAEKILPR